MIGKKTIGQKTFDVFNVIILLVLCLLTTYPFIHVLSISMSSPAEAIRSGLHIIPLEWDFGAYQKVLSADEIWVSYKNTIIRTVVGTILSLIATSMAAYALSEKRLPLRRVFMGMILITMYIKGGLIPTYLVVRSLGLIDSLWSMILPVLVYGFTLIILRNFFSAIPKELSESARIDGASDFRILFQIIIPLSLPAIATVALWKVVNHWNAYFDNLIYINSKELYVLQRMIRELIISSNSSYMDGMDTGALSTESIKSATIMVATIPILLFYPFVQKYYIKGVSMGAVKG